MRAVLGVDAVVLDDARPDAEIRHTYARKPPGGRGRPRGMRQATLPISEIGLIAATRGIAGAGAGLLIASRVPEKNRKMVGWGLFAIGVLTTIPFLIDVLRKSSKPNSPAEKRAAGPQLRPRRHANPAAHNGHPTRTTAR